MFKKQIVKKCNFNLKVQLSDTNRSMIIYIRVGQGNCLNLRVFFLIRLWGKKVLSKHRLVNSNCHLSYDFKNSVVI